MNEQYTEEVRARFKSTAAYKEYESKTAGYTRENWQNGENDINKVFAKFAECKDSGCTPDSTQAQALTKELQEFITSHFYTCTYEILNGLGVMYNTDERFKKNIDKHGLGTAEFISSAIEIYCKGLRK